MSDTFEHISHTYDALVAEHGDATEACDYGSPASQRVRFEVLAGVCDLSGLRVLDVGCGLAHYADYLDTVAPGVRYTGIDLSSRAIEAARARRPDLDLVVGNVLDLPPESEYDVVNANGIFYLLGEEAPQLMRCLIERMWSLARRAIVFTSLSTWAPERHEGEFQADPFETLVWCRQLSPFVVLRHDYLLHDFAVYLHREARR